VREPPLPSEADLVAAGIPVEAGLGYPRRPAPRLVQAEAVAPAEVVVEDESGQTDPTNLT
jgi:hypothetical protein